VSINDQPYDLLVKKMTEINEAALATHLSPNGQF
jgi:hypothetical protein